MQQLPFNAKELIAKYRSGNCTEEEKALVENWYDRFQSADFDLPEDFAQQDLNAVWDKIQHSKKEKRVIKIWKPITVAASILLVSSILLTIYLKDNKTNNIEQATVINEVLPGSNKAILTLSNGRKLNLSQSKNGVLTTQSGVQVYKSSNGQIAYNSKSEQTPVDEFNTIETPKGGEFKVILPDGTNVWLNAASSLKYPLSFNGSKERNVELTGEAYFEVAHNKVQPFHVKTALQTVEVLGTHFNVNSYSDEKSVVTTLEEGSVKVKSGAIIKTLKPGEASVLNKGSIVIQQADLETALAWKNGNTLFKSEQLETILRQIARWYNVTVIYNGAVSKRVFTGGMPRSTKLSVLLSVLKDSNINFKIVDTPTGKQLIVSP